VTNGANSGFFINLYYEDESEDKNLLSIFGGNKGKSNEKSSSTETGEADGNEGGTSLIFGIGVSVVLAAVVLTVLAMKKWKTAASQESKQFSICSCGAKNPPAAKFCQSCGKPLQ